MLVFGKNNVCIQKVIYKIEYIQTSVKVLQYIHKEVIRQMLFRPNKHEKTVISVRIDKELLDKIDKVANDANLSRNEIICQSIEFALDNADTEENE